MSTEFTLDNLMENQKYRIVFEGKIQPHSTLEEAKANMAALFKLDAAKVDALFTGHPITLKADLTFEEAENYKNAIDGTGAFCMIRSMEEKENVIHEQVAPQETPEEEAAPPPPPVQETTYSAETAHHVPLEDELAVAANKESKWKSIVPVALVVIILGVLAYFLFLKKEASIPVTDDEREAATLVKLENLRSVIQVAVTATLNKEMTFPQDIDEVKALMKDQAALMPREVQKQGEDILVDGWDQEMIYEFKGGMSYVIKSAGLDGYFETEDDLVLKDGEIKTKEE